MKELELKFLEIDKEALISKLKEKGARLHVDSILKTIYFDTKNGDFRSNDEVLRLRTLGDKVELCRKMNRRMEGECRASEELEVFVSNFDEMVCILESLGYVQGLVFEKIRTEYVLSDGSHFAIDEFPGIPVFVEIEAESVERINELAKEYGLQNYESTHKTGQEILREKYGVEVNGLKF